MWCPTGRRRRPLAPARGTSPLGTSRPLRLAIGSEARLRSQVWTVTTAGACDGGVSLGPEHDPCPTSRVRLRDAWTAYVPTDTGVHYGLEDLPTAPKLDQFLRPPAPGWRVGVILFVPAVALSARPGGTSAGITLLPTPPAGRSVVIPVLLGDPDRAALGDVPARPASSCSTTDSLLAQIGLVQVWRGQTVLAPAMSRHIIRTRQRLVEIAPAEPRQLPASSRFHTTGDVEVIVDLGLI